MLKDRAGNTFAEARSLGMISGKKAAKDWIGRSDKHDFYSFSLNRSSNVKIRLGQLKGNLDLTLFNQQEKRIGRSRNKKNKRELIQQTLSAGTYYIRVSRKRGKSSYKLKTVVSEAGPGNNDPNNSLPAVKPTGSTSENSQDQAQLTRFINKVVELTNSERAKAGVKPVTLDDELSKAAQLQVKDLAENDFFSHTSPSGTTLAKRLDQAGYDDYRTAGENIAAGQITPEQVVQEWMNSSGHRANLLSSDYTEIGVGYYFLANDTGDVNYNRYWAQAFGDPAS